jgi:hypothetical protein
MEPNASGLLLLQLLLVLLVLLVLLHGPALQAPGEKHGRNMRAGKQSDLQHLLKCVAGSSV